MTRSEVAVAAILVAGLMLDPSQASANIRFDGNVTNARPWIGVGGTVWPGDVSIRQAVADLNIGLVRLWSDVPDDLIARLTTLPPSATPAQLDAVWSAFPSGSAVRQSVAMLNASGVDVVLTIGIRAGMPATWLQAVNGNHVLLPPFCRVYGLTLAAGVAYLEALTGFRFPYLELLNEPDGTWSNMVNGTLYQDVLRATRSDLDRRGLSHVRIVGPGLSHVAPVDQYVGSVDASLLGAWSVHAYEWDTSVNAINGQQWMRRHFAAMAASSYPSSLPLIVTEFATTAFVFNGVAGNHSSVPYAARVASNLLELIYAGANGALIWEIHHQPSATTSDWGLLGADGTARPVYDAFRAITSRLPRHGVVLRPILLHGNLSAMALATTTAGSNVTVAIVNASPSSQTAIVALDGFCCPTCQPVITGATSWNTQAAPTVSLSASASSASFNVSVPVNAIVTVALACTSRRLATTRRRTTIAVPIRGKTSSKSVRRRTSAGKSSRRRTTIAVPNRGKTSSKSARRRTSAGKSSRRRTTIAVPNRGKTSSKSARRRTSAGKSSRRNTTIAVPIRGKTSPKSVRRRTSAGKSSRRRTTIAVPIRGKTSSKSVRRRTSAGKSSRRRTTIAVPIRGKTSSKPVRRRTSAGKSSRRAATIAVPIRGKASSQASRRRRTSAGASSRRTASTGIPIRRQATSSGAPRGLLRVSTSKAAQAIDARPTTVDSTPFGLPSIHWPSWALAVSPWVAVVLFVALIVTWAGIWRRRRLSQQRARETAVRNLMDNLADM
ncbi:unnamed protein product (mitochondrion) [Plasmodiophora brassicae]|uniref:Glycoside hydrolase family 5 domain-containing protein n=1 Tax=Plasmodiophora brassicae TaxID=37360 RepID=A0A3P3YKK6_PLABS|nr:unnamed protein product [Plasmodiophora brassicae]